MRTQHTELAQKVIWITGASSGIGRATALEAARRGYRVALTARRKELLEQLRKEMVGLGAHYPDIVVVAGDVTDSEAIGRLHAEILSTFGAVDILLANAGSHAPTSGGDLDVAQYRSLFELNVFGALNCISAVLPEMRRRRSGHIAGVSSVAGYRALPTAAAYGATKAAFTYILESLRFDLEREGIAVTVVSPGFVRTPLTDRNDFSMPCIVEPEVAANEIMDGLERKAFEIHFPKRFTLALKLLGFLPARIYHSLLERSIVR